MKKGMRKEIKKEKGKMLTLENVNTGKCQDGQRWVPDEHPSLEALSHA